MIPAVAPRYGGPSKVAVEMCRALRATGVEAELLATDADGGNRLAVPLEEATSWDGVPARFFRRYLGEGLKASPGLAAWLRREIRSYDVLHVHAFFSFSTLAAAILARDHHVPYFIQPHGTLEGWSVSQKTFRKRLFRALGGSGALRGAQAALFTTERERRETALPGSDPRSEVVPLGVDETLFSEPRPETLERALLPAGVTEPFALFLGRLHPKKRLEELLSAFEDVTRAPALARWTLVLAGDGDPSYVEPLKRRFEVPGSEGRIRFPGWVSGLDRERLLRLSSVSLLLSSQENFALSVAEAMACGRAVVVSEEVGVADDVRRHDAGWVVPTERFAAALAEALSNDSERSRRGANGRRLAEAEYRWNRVAGRLSALYAGAAVRREAARPTLEVA